MTYKTKKLSNDNIYGQDCLGRTQRRVVSGNQTQDDQAAGGLVQSY